MKLYGLDYVIVKAGSPNHGAPANRRPALQSDASDNLSATLAADRAFPAAVADLGRLAADRLSMKFAVILATMLLTCVGCRSHTVMPESSRTIPGFGGRALSQRPHPTHLIRGLAAPGAGNFGRRVFEVGNHRFTEIDDFMAFVRSLPRGSILAWDSGCWYYETIPLEHSEMSIAGFEDFCEDYGVQFRYIYGY
jgi:hypothetical protein